MFLDDIWTKQLVWYGRLQRMDEKRLPKKISNWIRTGGRKRGKLKTRLKECGLQDGDWEVRLRWRLGVEKRCHTYRTTTYIITNAIIYT
jgi:hypothetical protein